ncbi:MAG TPA: hypothetical protein PK873_10470 [Pseudomonas sp.]|nr:hypothetical protein [Pseudomonas sp.]HRL93977.1 hypothetical protein [Pseudomonas sp.]
MAASVSPGDEVAGWATMIDLVQALSPVTVRRNCTRTVPLLAQL